MIRTEPTAGSVRGVTASIAPAAGPLEKHAERMVLRPSQPLIPSEMSSALVPTPTEEDTDQKLARLMQECLSLRLIVQPLEKLQTTLALAIVRKMCHRQGAAVYQTIDATIPYPRQVAGLIFPPEEATEGSMEKSSISWTFSTHEKAESIMTPLFQHANGF
jgi:hypothetical protein